MDNSRAQHNDVQGRNVGQFTGKLEENDVSPALISEKSHTSCRSQAAGAVMRCVRIGYGTIAHLHERKLRALGVEGLGVMERDGDRANQAERDGHRVISGYREAAKLRPDLWDVCVPTDQHLHVIRQIVQEDQMANILVEKPICSSSQIGDLRRLLSRFRGKLVVNENYLSSSISPIVWEEFWRHAQAPPTRITVEMSKDRTADFGSGRFVDVEGGAIGYEGPHMLAIIGSLGEEYLPGAVRGARFEDARFSIGAQHIHLIRQGSAELSYTARCGIDVEVFTSLMGEVRHPFPPFFTGTPLASSARYRIMSLEGQNRSGKRIAVIGFYEPVPGFARGQGAVCVMINSRIHRIIAPVEDDSMRAHMDRAIAHFRDRGDNPGPAMSAVHIVELLDEDRWTERVTADGRPPPVGVKDKHFRGGKGSHGQEPDLME